MIQIDGVTKVYGDTTALSGISTRIERGEVVGLLGPNGAGKTTAMKIVVGYLLPTTGTVRVGGHDVTAEPLEVQRLIGYLPENAPLYTDMLVQDYLRFIADMRGLTTGSWRRRLGEVAEECGIDRVLTRPIGHLSKGFRQRVGLAASILHDPAILILDEPTTGLDPNQIMEVRELIRRLGETKTVILSTHILPEVEASCGRAVILIDGRIRADGPLAELTRSRVQVVTIAPPSEAEARELFGRIDGVGRIVARPDGERFTTFRLELTDDQDVAEEVWEAVRARGWPLRELKRDDKSLEQVFKELTESGVEAAA